VKTAVLVVGNMRLNMGSEPAVLMCESALMGVGLDIAQVPVHQGFKYSLAAVMMGPFFPT
jgi:hypothetical protein